MENFGDFSTSHMGTQLSINWSIGLGLCAEQLFICPGIHFLALFCVKAAFSWVSLCSFLSRLGKDEEGVKRQENNKIFPPLLSTSSSISNNGWVSHLASVLLYGPSCSLSFRCYRMTPASWALIIFCHFSIGISISISMAFCGFYSLSCLGFPCLGSQQVQSSNKCQC